MVVKMRTGYTFLIIFSTIALFFIGIIIERIFLMRKLAVKKCLFVTAMMATGLSYSDDSTKPVSTDTLAAMDGDFNFTDGFIGDMHIPVVLTAARLRQSQLDAPASVTIIEADTIEALGFKDIEEIFRLVPGMLVAYHSGVSEKTASVSYHGTNLP